MQCSNSDASSSVSQVSDVHLCRGMTRLETNRALLTSSPQRMPHISRFFLVFSAAAARNFWRSWVGRKTGRSGSPFSRYPAGRNVIRLSFVVSLTLGGRIGGPGWLDFWSCDEAGVRIKGSFRGRLGGWLTGGRGRLNVSFGGRGGCGLGLDGSPSYRTEDDLLMEG